MGVVPANFSDSMESFPYTIDYPENIRDLKRLQLITDFGAQPRNYIDIIQGRMGEDQVFVVDENNNKDLRDDSVRIPQFINWLSDEQLVPCKYSLTNGEEVFEDSSWLRLGILRKGLWCLRSEHLIAEFCIEEDRYKVGIADPRIGDFTYRGVPQAALLSHNSHVKDTLLENDLIIQGEILTLNDSYYRFENISHYGDYLTLVKVADFEKLVGTQLGMLAPEFSCVSVMGDTIFSSDLPNKILLISNTCGCGGDILSARAYYDISKKFGDQILHLRLDSHMDKGDEGIPIDMEVGYNKDMYRKYRNTYCSRTCYVIGRDNRILDKFPVTDWKTHLPTLITN